VPPNMCPLDGRGPCLSIQQVFKLSQNTEVVTISYLTLHNDQSVPNFTTHLCTFTLGIVPPILLLSKSLGMGHILLYVW
jgi:hypothetical protein